MHCNLYNSTVKYDLVSYIYLSSGIFVISGKLLSEYTVMVDSLAAAFDRLTEKYMHRISSSDEEIAVEFQIPTPSRKHKLKDSESPQVPQKKRKRKSHTESGTL